MLWRSVLALVCTALFSISALADSPVFRGSRIAAVDDTPTFKWSGVYFGAGVGYGVGASNLEVDVATGNGFQNLLGIDGLSSQGWRGDLKAGIDFRLGNSAFVLGVFGKWTPDGFGDTDFSASVAGSTVLTGAFAPEWSVGARVGLILPNQTLVYAGPTWNQGEISFNAPGCHNGPNCSGSKTVDGYGAVAGFEVPLGGAWTFGLEGSWTLYDRATLVEVENEGRVTVQHEDFSGMARLNFRPLGLFGN